MIIFNRFKSLDSYYNNFSVGESYGTNDTCK